jgi:glycine/D-amino acid oxidase-like deaminating enzyme
MLWVVASKSIVRAALPPMTISLTDGSLGSPQRRALWLRDALEAEVNHEPRRLTGEERFDVAIVGGGFTGMWTALELIKRAPGTRIALLEADICGAGASGRNGGFAMNWWAKFASLEQLCGTEAALELCQRSAAAVAQIGSFCAEHGIADAFKQDGWLWAATNKAQLGAWENDVASIERAGAHPFKQLDAAEAAALGGSPQHLGGVFDGSTAAVQPAMIARALREALVGARVEVYEQSPALSISGGRISSPQGTLDADQVVLALNAWSAQIPELSRGLVVVASDILVTDPIPDGVGPLNQVTISDSRRLVNYYRRTPDRRMMFGRGGGTLAYRRRITPDFDRPGPRTDGVTEQLWRIYPALRKTLIAETWSGPIDYSLSGLPFIVRLREMPNVIAAAGFSGDGVGPSRLVGELLAQIVSEGGDAGLPKALTTVPRKRLPPEPIRYVGGRTVRAATAIRERAEDNGHRASILIRALASLDPTSGGHAH